MVYVDFSVWLSHAFQIVFNTPDLGWSKWKLDFCAAYSSKVC